MISKIISTVHFATLPQTEGHLSICAPASVNFSREDLSTLEPRDVNIMVQDLAVFSARLGQTPAPVSRMSRLDALRQAGGADFAHAIAGESPSAIGGGGRDIDETRQRARSLLDMIAAAAGAADAAELEPVNVPLPVAVYERMHNTIYSTAMESTHQSMSCAICQEEQSP